MSGITIAIVTAARADANRLEVMLGEDGFGSRVYTTAREAIRGLSRDMPDIVIVDTTPADNEGDPALSRIRAVSDIPVIVFADGDPDEVEELVAFRMGADDYVLKSSSDHLVLERVRTLLRRIKAARFPRDAVPRRLRPQTVGDIEIDPAAHSVRINGHLVSLPKNGFALVQAMARYPGRLLHREQLLEAMDFHPECDHRLVDGHVKRTRRAFRKVDPEFDAIQTVYGLGYKLEPASAG